MAEDLNETQLAEKLRRQADELKVRFHEHFWDEQLECYVLALDQYKRPCRVKSSNAGQLLYTGIVPDEVAGRLARTLLGPDMFSGWGLRTASTEAARYNPMSYHNGSVWPHDVSLVAMGLAQYGFREESRKLAASLFDASLFLPLQRLPELYCGCRRRKGEGPTPYPVACSPQAWSVAAVFQILEALLLPSFENMGSKVTFDRSELPDYLESIRIKGLLVGASPCDVQIERAINGGFSARIT